MRVLVVSDLHGNIEALRSVVAAEPRVDRVLCLGDLVDYGPRPDEIVTWVREHALATVRGNHDNAVALGEDCRSAPLFRRLSVESRRKTTPMLSPENLAFLRALPTRTSLVLDGIRLELLHAAPRDPLFQYLPASRVDEWRDAARGIDAELILVGHTHVPVVVELDRTWIVNPGSVARGGRRAPEGHDLKRTVVRRDAEREGSVGHRGSVRDRRAPVHARVERVGRDGRRLDRPLDDEAGDAALAAAVGLRTRAAAASAEREHGYGADQVPEMGKKLCND
jgi:protein phosphatase